MKSFEASVSYVTTAGGDQKPSDVPGHSHEHLYNRQGLSLHTRGSYKIKEVPGKGG